MGMLLVHTLGVAATQPGPAHRDTVSGSSSGGSSSSSNDGSSGSSSTDTGSSTDNRSGSGPAAQLDGLNDAQIIAAALALHRRLGPSSPWSPYLGSLPSQPPAPWLLPPGELQDQLQQYGERAALTWPRAVAAYGARMRADAEAVEQLLGAALHVGAADVLWGLAQVVPLTAGQEVCICYAGELSPLQAFLKFGFVPDEKLLEADAAL